MPSLRAIALVITVLTVAAPYSATADIFGRGDCTPEPGSEVFDPIGCRLWALRHNTYELLGRRGALNRVSGNAWDRVFSASGFCQDAARLLGRERLVAANTRVARRHLRRAATLLDR